MKNRNILMLMGFILIIFLSGCTIDSSDKNIIKVDNPEQQLPKDIEFYDYIVDIEDTRYYDDYVLLRYTITTKDHSPITEREVLLLIDDKLRTIVYGLGIHDLSTKQLSEDKLEVTSRFFIAASSNDSLEISYSLIFSSDNSKEDKKIDNVYTFNKTNEDFISIQDKKNIDNMNITIESIGNFDFGSLFNFYIEYMEGYTLIDKNKYKIKLKSGEYNNTYEIKPLIGYGKEHIDSLSSFGNFNKNAEVINFYNSVLEYDPDSVDLDDFQIYLVNNDTKEETLLYSK